MFLLNILKFFISFRFQLDKTQKSKTIQFNDPQVFCGLYFVSFCSNIAVQCIEWGELLTFFYLQERKDFLLCSIKKK